jgi:hypothetical protein
MILPNFILPSRKSQEWTEFRANDFGCDALDLCRDPDHFLAYPHKISYKFNSRGFRDCEWPDNMTELQNSIWCVGDSQLLGIGCPLEHTWSNILQRQTGQRCINISLDGASNAWIARKTVEILKTISPNVIVIQWSYIQRGEIDNESLSDEDRRLACWSNDFNRILNQNYKLLQTVEANKNNCTVIHSCVPGADLFNQAHMLDVWNCLKGPSWPAMPKTQFEFLALDKKIVAELTDFFKIYDTFNAYFILLENMIMTSEIDVIDLARDKYHYDILTATKFVDDVAQLICKHS